MFRDGFGIVVKPQMASDSSTMNVTNIWEAARNMGDGNLRVIHSYIHNIPHLLAVRRSLLRNNIPIEESVYPNTTADL